MTEPLFVEIVVLDGMWRVPDDQQGSPLSRANR
jgi:hypothetical protein